MARKFRGESENRIDAKGRVSIPHTFRRVLESGDPDWNQGENPNFVVVYGDHRRDFLEVYTIAAINEVDDQVSALPRGSKERRILEKLFNGQSLPAAVDETGRIVLPQKLRDKIGLKDTAFFIATGDTFQIWEPTAYREQARADEEWLDGLPQDFDPLMLLERAGQEAEA